jgi:adenylate cyclase
MGTEIERKFLIADERWRELADAGQRVRQGYLAGNERCSARVRIAGEHASLNFKGMTLAVTRREYEYRIPLSDAEEMLEHLCSGPLIEKVRYRVPYEGHVWEVDCFDGDNAGLVVAEIELGSSDEAFAVPDWVGREVSDKARYYNVRLIEHPYLDWDHAERAGD